MLEAGSAKIWVYKNGDTKIQHKGKADDDSLNKICKYIKNNYMIILKKWEEKFGRLEIYGEPYILYTVKGDELKPFADIQDNAEKLPLFSFGVHKYSDESTQFEVATSLLESGHHWGDLSKIVNITAERYAELKAVSEN